MTISILKNKDNNRNLTIDILKSLAAFLVCFYHFQLLDFGLFENGIYIPNLNKILIEICSASVPLFFLLSGIFALQKHKGSIYYLTKSFNCIKIYVIWGLLLGVINNLIQHKQISLISTISNIDFLWFFQSLAVLYIYSMLYFKIKHTIYIHIILVALLICPFLLNLIYDVVILINPNITPIHTGFFRLYSIIYFSIPFYFKISSKFWSLFFIFIGILLITFEVFVYSNYYSMIYDGVNSSFPTIGALLLTWGIYSIFVKLKFNYNILTKYTSFLGQNCLGIYIIHMPLIFLFREYISVEKTSPLIAIILTLIIITISSLIFTLLKKIPFISWTLKL